MICEECKQPMEKLQYEAFNTIRCTNLRCVMYKFEHIIGKPKL